MTDFNISSVDLVLNVSYLSHRNRPIDMLEHMQCPGSGGPPLSD